MFVLRVVYENIPIDEEIGKIYSVIDRFYAPKRFRAIYKRVFGKDHVADLYDSADNHSKGIIKFVQADGHPICIWKDRTYFVINSSGKTHDCLNRAQ